MWKQSIKVKYEGYVVQPDGLCPRKKPLKNYIFILRVKYKHVLQ